MRETLSWRGNARKRAETRKRGDENRFLIAASGGFAPRRAKAYGLPALDALPTERLKVVPLSRCRLPPFKLRVEPPCAEVSLEWVICSPLSEPVKLPVVFAVALVVAATVLPTAVVAPAATLPTVDVVVLRVPPTVLPTPPSKPPPRCPPLTLEPERADACDDELAMVCDPNISSLADCACARA